MRKLVLFLLLLVPIVLGALAGTSYWFGIQAENAYREMLDQAARDGRFTLSDSRYERGWFSSNATATVTPAAVPLPLTVSGTIHHGPFPMPEGFPPEWLPLTAVIDNRIALASVANLPSLTARTRIDLDRQNTTQLEFPAYKLTRDGSTIEWQAMRGELSGGGDSRRLATSLQTASLQFSGADGDLRLSTLSVRAERKPAPSGLSLVDFSLGADKLSSKRAAGQTVLDGLKLTMSSDEKDGNLGITLAAEFRQLHDGNKTYGPAQFALRLSRLDSAALLRFQQQVAADKSGASPEPPLNPLGKAMETLGALARKSPELELTRLSVKTPDGEFTGRGRLTLDGSNLDAADNPLLLVSTLGGEGEISLPSGLVKALAERDIERRLEEHKRRGDLSAEEIRQLTPEKTAEIKRKALPGAIEGVVRNLHLVADGDHYRARAALTRGRLLVNGQPLEQPLRLPLP